MAKILGTHRDLRVVTQSVFIGGYSDGRKVKRITFIDEDGDNIEMEFHQFAPHGDYYMVKPERPKQQWWQFWRV